MLKEVLAAWEPYRGITAPPAEPVWLWHDAGRTIFIDDNHGPAVPYPTVDHSDGTRNHGYMRLKGNPAAIAQVPEAQGWPEFQAYLQSINAVESPIESVGCEKGFFPVEGKGDATVKIGSYVDVVFSNLPLNDDPEHHLRLAAVLAGALEGCEQWWAALEIGLQRFRGLYGCAAPWGLMVRVCNYARNEDEARRFWGESLTRLGREIEALPADFPRGAN